MGGRPGARRGIVCTNDETSNTRIEGFTITNGWTNSNGGGMFNNNSHPMLTDCIFENNTAYYGGGMCNDSSSPTLTNCTFKNNIVVQHGGGIYNGEASNPTITNCTFTSNYAEKYGAGIANYFCSPTLENCTFENNIADLEGGGMNNSFSSPTLKNCVFINNTSGGNGGGLYSNGSSSINSLLENCTITNNISGGTGAGIWCVQTDPTLINTTVCGNTPDQIDGFPIDGGGNTIADDCPVTWTVDDDGPADFNNIQAAVDAASDGDEILVMPGTYTGTGNRVVDLNLGNSGQSLTLRSTKGPFATIIDGQNNRGGLLCRTDGDLVIDGFTITRCFDQDGAGMSNMSSAEVLNCIFSDNVAEDDGGAVRNGTWQGNNEFWLPTFTNCSFVDNSTGMWGGAMKSGGPITVTLVNCTFENNSANVQTTWASGGAIANASNNMIIEGCTIQNNFAIVTGGGIYKSETSGGYTNISNTVICNNLPNQISGPWYDEGGNTIENTCVIDDPDGDGDGVGDSIDNCYLYNPDQADCNGNGIGDICDLADFTSYDCDQNSVPDECQPDCDGDGFIDPCDNDSDVDGDGIPDNCEPDCNENGIPDDFEIKLGIATDCNNNNIPDSCDMENDPSLDCDGNNAFDACEIESDPSLDCDNNGTLDSCELMDGPVEETTTMLLAGDGQPGDEFGYSISISGDRALIGALADDDNAFNAGAAYVFSLEGDEWIEEAKLIASDGETTDEFGFSVSIFGDVAVIGADDDDNENGTNAGSVYVFRFDSSEWIEEAKLIASDGESQEHFGSSVSISEETIIVGADHNGGNGVRSGAAYIYRFDGSQWAEEAKLLSNDGTVNDYFGHSVSISGDTAVIGALGDDDYGSDSGSAYIYRFDGSAWMQELKLLANDAGYGDLFGKSVAISGNTVLIGAPKNDGQGGDCVPCTDAGTAYIFQFDGINWNFLVQLFTFGSNGGNYNFGSAVSIEEDSLVIGAPGYNIGGGWLGAAFKFEFDGEAWVENQILLANNGEASDYFGSKVSISGNKSLVSSGLMNSAYVFESDNSGNDCDEDGNLDSCQIEEDPSLDCNQDGILDSCQELDDCDDNGIADSCDLQDPDNDQNNNGEMDVCECISDITDDGIVNIHDLLIVIGSWGAANPAADFNFDDIVNIHDLLIFIGAWGPCE